jgi:hypothetical protein
MVTVAVAKSPSGSVILYSELIESRIAASRCWRVGDEAIESDFCRAVQRHRLERHDERVFIRIEIVGEDIDRDGAS